MAHHHGRAHLVRRQRGRDDDDDQGPQVETVVQTRIVMAPNTFGTQDVDWITQTEDAPKTLLAPAVRPRPTSTTKDADAKPTSKAGPSSKPLPSFIAPSASRAKKPDDDSATVTRQDTTLMVATKAPTPSAPAALSGLASATATIGAAASAGADQGMSGGAKAGLALGILLGVGALLVGILLVYRRKKKQMLATAQENEKTEMYNAPAPPPPQVQAAPAPIPKLAIQPVPTMQSERSPSTAPRLELRPLTQFDPAFDNSSNNNSGASNLLAVAPPTPSKERDLPDRPRSAWERPGAANVTPTENPFNDPHAGPLSANPFGNNAAVDASQAKIPDSPPNASPMHSSKPSADFANPGRAITEADIDPVAAATAMASVPPPTQTLMAPPTINAATDGVPPSPAWTEDFPASPGPAPTGPPPVAGALVGGQSNGPAPGPNNVHRVQLDFKPSMQDELGLNAGQLVRMLHEYDDGWALCIRMDRSQQGVVPRTCLSKHPVKPRNGPPRQAPPPGMRGPPIRSPIGLGGVPRPLSPASGPNSPLPPASGRNSPGPRQMSPHMQGPPRGRSNSNAPQYGPPRGRSNSNAPYAAPQRSMSPGPYGGGPQMAPPPQMGRPRANSANQVGNMRRGPAPGPSPMNPSAAGPIPARKPVPGMAI
jgi:hypothetical protein